MEHFFVEFYDSVENHFLIDVFLRAGGKATSVMSFDTAVESP